MALVLFGCLVAAANAAVLAPPPGTVVDGVAPATVLRINPAGIGHVNLVPMYMAMGEYDTYINIVNTDTRNGKVIKLRFLAAENGDTAFNATLFLAPGDVWAAAITGDPVTHTPKLVHNDRGCTLPAQVQKPFDLDRLSVAYGEVAGNGYVEIITIADIPPRSGPFAPPLFSTIKAGTNAAPCSPAVLDAFNVDATSYAQAQARGLEVPTTGLMTRWTLINVPRATSYTGLATALEARVAPAAKAGYGNIVMFPQTTQALGDLAAIRRYTADPLLRGGVMDNRTTQGQSLAAVAPELVALMQDLPDLSTPYLPEHLDPTLPPGAAPRMQAFGVSRLLATTSVANEHLLQPGVSARTDWVISMPTRRYGVGIAYFRGSPSANIVPNPMFFTNYTVDDVGNPLPAPLANHFAPSLDGTANGGPSECLRLSPDASVAPPVPRYPRHRTGTFFADLEGLSTDFYGVGDNGGWSWRPTGMCGQTVVIRFLGGDLFDWTQGLFGWTMRTLRVGSNAVGGWLRLYTPGHQGLGVPLIGFAAMELSNNAVAPGFAGSFGQVFPHTTTAPD